MKAILNRPSGLSMSVSLPLFWWKSTICRQQTAVLEQQRSQIAIVMLYCILSMYICCMLVVMADFGGVNLPIR